MKESPNPYNLGDSLSTLELLIKGCKEHKHSFNLVIKRMLTFK